MRLALCLVLMLPLPAQAQDWIDFDLLLRENAALVETTTDANGDTLRKLSLGDGVMVECSDDGCFGTDAAAALGCTFAIITDMTALNASCPGSLDAGATERLQTGFERMGRFIEENAVPPRAPGYAQGLLDAAIAAEAGEDGAKRLETCKRLQPGGDLAEMLGYLSGEAFPGELEQALAHPRLPVMNPCL